ncbi:MAG: outer membrane beta-barrel protein [Bacteroidota bacterium]|nr:outer membrane beta-barrel protein [Bacteroidota bacterium]
MDKDLHNIEELFKSGLGDHEEMPSVKVWDAVDNRLDKDTVVAIKKKYKTWKRLSLLLLLLLVGLSIYEINNRYNNTGIAKTNGNGTDKEIIAGNNNNEGQPNKNTVSSKEQADINDINNDITVNTIPGKLTADKSIPDNDVLPQSDNNLFTDKSGKYFITNKKNIQVDGNAIVNTPASFQVFPASIKKNNPEKTRPFKPLTNNSVALVQNNAVPVNEPFSLPRQLSFISIEKINSPDFLSTGTKKIWESLALTKNTSSVVAAAAASVKKKQNQPGSFSITGFFSPDRASYRLENDDQNNQPANANQIKKTEKHEVSSTSGIFVDYRLNNRWSLQSGVTFSNTNISIEPQTLYAQADNAGDIKYRVNLSSGYAYILPTFQSNPVIGDSVYASAAEHKLRYLGIPLAAKYNLTKGKLSVEVMAGAGINILTKGKFETEIQRGVNNEIDIIDNIQGLKSIYINGLAGIGAEYKVTKNISITVMPTARFAFMPINKGAVVKTFPNSFGLAGGLKIKL